MNSNQGYFLKYSKGGAIILVALFLSYNMPRRKPIFVNSVDVYHFVMTFDTILLLMSVKQ
jgi:hypothetical protein